MLYFDQKHRLGIILKVVNTHLGIPQDAETKWTVDGELASGYTHVTSLLNTSAHFYIMVYILNLHICTCTLIICIHTLYRYMHSYI